MKVHHPYRPHGYPPRRWAWILVVLLLASCNFPGLRTPEQRPPGGLTREELRATLRAQVAGAPAPQTTPIPGQTPGAPETAPAQPPEPVEGLATATPGELPTLPPPGSTPTPFISADNAYYTYTTQSGDTLPALAGRFGVTPEEIVFLEPVTGSGLLPLGMPAAIPNRLGSPPFSAAVFPDSEVIYSPSAADFDLYAIIQQAGGFLSTYQETVEGESFSGAQVVERVVQETSTNPRLLLALLNYSAGWVTGQPPSPEKVRYPFGFYVSGYSGLYKELSLAAKQLNIGYYGWRAGTLTEIKFREGQLVRLSPQLNPGSIAMQFLFSKMFDPPEWGAALYTPGTFLEHYSQLFGDPWQRAAAVGPLIPDGLTQPALELPIAPGERWSLTGGPHVAWNTGTPRGALDLAPVTGEAACSVSRAWVLASSAGQVVRSRNGVVVLDLDGDGSEATGWVLFYLHIAGRDRIPEGTWVEADAPLGHPSCEGGNATGTHVHLARKYNGEWLPADAPVPFVLSGWQAHAGSRSYEGTLTRDGQVVSANPSGNRTSIIVR